MYNCVVFLNQLQLSKDDSEDTPSKEEVTKKHSQQPTSLPASLINTYFHLFEMTVKKDEAQKKKKGSKKQQSSNAKDTSSTSGMKSRLLGALLTGVNRAHPYLPKKDAAMEQHIDALYRISHTAPPAAATQGLMLLFQLAVGSGEDGKETSNLMTGREDESVTKRKDRFYRALYSKLVDPEMFAGRQLTLFFNLLYKAMKYDTSTERIAAFCKRLVNTVLHQSSSIICGSLFLLSEIIKSHPELQSDIDASASEVLFDPTKREPRAAFPGAKSSLPTNLWELSLLAHHFHPSVTKFTAGSSGAIAYKGDPLKDFGLSPFLDKFAFRNPKSLDKLSKQLKRGESIAERKSGLSGSMALPMNDPSYLQSTNISEENSFFHQFFVERAKRDEIKGIVRGSGAAGNDDDKDASDLEDEALEAAEADEMIDNFDGDTDSEEEAFVTQLAEKLMADAAGGKGNLDEEDPDMDGWSDFNSDDDDENEDEDGEKDIGRMEGDDSGNDGNEDAFMDAASSDEDEGDAIDAATEDGSGSSGDDIDFAMLGEEEESDDVSEEEKNTTKQSKKRKKSTSMFADAEEYEKVLEEESKNLQLQRKHGNEEDSDEVEADMHTQKKSKRKKK